MILLMCRLCLAGLLFALPMVSSAAVEDDVLAATHTWAAAYNTRVTDNVVALYAEDAVFWGTVSPIIRDTPALVRDYFKGMPERPNARVEIGDYRVRVYGDVAINTGFYTFSNVTDGVKSATKARFTFGYRRTPSGDWEIVSHHSSRLPE